MSAEDIQQILAHNKKLQKTEIQLRKEMVEILETNVELRNELKHTKALLRELELKEKTRSHGGT